MATVFIDLAGQDVRRRQFEESLNLQRAGLAAGAFGTVADAALKFSHEYKAEQEKDINRISMLATQLGGLDRLYQASPGAFSKFEDLSGVQFKRNPDGTPDIPIDEKTAYQRKLFEISLGVLQRGNPDEIGALTGTTTPRNPSEEAIHSADRETQMKIAEFKARQARIDALIRASSVTGAARIRADALLERDKSKPWNQASGMYLMDNGKTTTNPRIAAKRGGVELTTSVAKFREELKNDRVLKGKNAQATEKLALETERIQNRLATFKSAEPLLDLAAEQRRSGNNSAAQKTESVILETMLHDLPPDNILVQEFRKPGPWSNLWSGIVSNANKLRKMSGAQTAVESHQADKTDPWSVLLDAEGVPP